MVRLLNSAVMPQAGVYTLRRLAPEAFREAVRAAALAPAGIESFVGYQQTAAHIHGLTGVPVALSRAPCLLEDGDTLLICRLAYRVADPGSKGQAQREEWEYFACEYRAGEGETP